MTAKGLPSFSHIDIVGFKAHLENLLKNNLDRIKFLLQSNPVYTWDNLIYPLDDLEDSLERLWSPFSHLHAVMDTEIIRKSYEACLPLLSSYESSIGQNKALYEAIKSIDARSLDNTQKKILTDTLLGFELSGVGLAKIQQKRFEAIQTRLSEIETQFENNILDATQAFTLHISDSQRLSGLPEHALNTARELAQEKSLEGYMLTLEAPCFQAVMSYCDDRALREQMYQAYVTRASDQGPNANQFDNSELMNEILRLRHEKAQLLGFNNYSELSLATKMAESPNQVIDFMLNLIGRARNQGLMEFDELERFAKEQLHISPFNPWDSSYASEKRRQALYSLSQEELRSYFPQPKVMHGLFATIHKLYGMRLEQLKEVDVWHKDVQCFAVIDVHGTIRGYVYTDLYARPHKHGGAWMDSMQSRRKLDDGTLQKPIATLTCNFAKASGKKPACLSHDEVVTLFHEMGHCLHHLLTQVDYLGASGINGVEWDAVELPSQFFENWCWEHNALLSMSAHVDTGEPLPEVLYTRLIESKNFQSAMGLLRQMEYSLFDFRLHEEPVSKESLVADILSEVRSKTSIIPPVSYNRFQHSFSHIFGGGYAAGYYSYSWAEVLSSDAFSRFEEEGVFNTNTGHDFLKHILEVGSSKPAAEAFENFRGRAPTIDALLRHNGIQ